MSHYFRPPEQFTSIENAALDLCEGHVLDVGAGSGLHSLVLQTRGLAVTAIDISSQAVEIMVQRGVREVLCADVLQFEASPFDTLLMLGHGIGMVEDIKGLDRFFEHAHRLVKRDGQMLINSTDVRKTDDPTHLAYHKANRQAGRYIGEVRLQLEFEGRCGPYCGWLHVDQETLRRQAASAGWECETVLDEGADYLACLRASRS